MDKYIFFTVDDDGDVLNWTAITEIENDDDAMAECQKEAEMIGEEILIAKVIGKAQPKSSGGM